ncbi:MAG: hypothetical protein Kilf2KO_22470 [Rhodospirillales bacterium]
MLQQDRRATALSLPRVLGICLLLLGGCAGRGAEGPRPSAQPSAQPSTQASAQPTMPRQSECIPGFRDLKTAVAGQRRSNSSRVYYVDYTFSSCRSWQGVAFEGRITPTSVENVIQAYAEKDLTSPERFILLNSSGGQLKAGLRLAQFIIEEDLIAIVGRRMICASMCSFIFITANTRIMHDSARLGIHSASDRRGRAALQINQLLARILTAVPGARADAYLSLANATPPDKITWLSAKEAENLGFTD